MDERNDVDEFTGYRLDRDAKPLSRKAVWIRSSVGLLTLIIVAINDKDELVQIGQGLRRFFERSIGALS